MDSLALMPIRIDAAPSMWLAALPQYGLSWPLGPDNLLCFMNGPLTGTEANMSGRMAVVTKSPLTGTVTDSHQGGWSAARIRWAGFDGLHASGRNENRGAESTLAALATRQLAQRYGVLD